jgi:5-methyltetrahydrofolate--homocysteine methyltransferase
MIGRTVRMTLAEAASKWLDANQQTESRIKIIKPAAGYASRPDHTLKGDILKILGVLKRGDHHHEHDHGCSCGCGGHHEGMGIELTESYAMTPESSICGLIFMHPEACYPEIRRISREAYEDYAKRRGMDEMTAQRFLGHLLK